MFTDKAGAAFNASPTWHDDSSKYVNGVIRRLRFPDDQVICICPSANSGSASTRC